MTTSEERVAAAMQETSTAIADWATSLCDTSALHTIRQVGILDNGWDCNEALADGAMLLAVGFATSLGVPRFVVGWADTEE